MLWNALCVCVCVCVCVSARTKTVNNYMFSVYLVCLTGSTELIMKGPWINLACHYNQVFVFFYVEEQSFAGVRMHFNDGASCWGFIECVCVWGRGRVDMWGSEEGIQPWPCSSDPPSVCTALPKQLLPVECYFSGTTWWSSVSLKGEALCAVLCLLRFSVAWLWCCFLVS